MAETVDGKWDCLVDSGGQSWAVVADIATDGDAITGTVSSREEVASISYGRLDGAELLFALWLTKPVPLWLECAATVEGDSLSGTVKSAMGVGRFVGVRL
jgi:hypothetical protein